jgi:DNA polymerase I-like protein with 3'-5' exonuclease and polymerase domains
MISVDAWLQGELARQNLGQNPGRTPDACLVMQVHDELVFEVREDRLDWLKNAVVGHMSGAADLNVPLVVDTGYGPDWETAH